MRTFVALITVALSACATSGARYVPVVDLRGHSQAQYAADLSKCQQYATQRMDAAQGALIGAIGSAILGAVVSPRGYRNEVAGKAALLGAGVGAAGANETQETIIKRCLAGRGYNVLS